MDTPSQSDTEALPEHTQRANFAHLSHNVLGLVTSSLEQFVSPYSMGIPRRNSSGTFAGDAYRYVVNIDDADDNASASSIPDWESTDSGDEQMDDRGSSDSLSTLASVSYIDDDALFEAFSRLDEMEALDEEEVPAEDVVIHELNWDPTQHYAPQPTFQDIMSQLFRDNMQDGLARDGRRLPPELDIFAHLFAERTDFIDNDSGRAATLLSALEDVSEELITRYEKLRSGQGDDTDGCAVCRETLLQSTSPPQDTSSDSAFSAALFSALPFHPVHIPVRAFPCPGMHLFHEECLEPWLARKSTCPTCRYDIDPDSLTLRKPETLQLPGMSIRLRSAKRRWQAPKALRLEEWLDRKEWALLCPSPTVSRSNDRTSENEEFANEMFLSEDDEAAWTDTDSSVSDQDLDPHLLQHSELPLSSSSSQGPAETQLGTSYLDNDPPLSNVASYDIFENVIRNEMIPHRRAYGASIHRSSFDVHDDLLENMVTDAPPGMQHLLDLID